MTLLGEGKVVQFSNSMILEIFCLISLCFLLATGVILFSECLSKLNKKYLPAVVLAFNVIALICCNLWHGWSYATNKTDYLEVSSIIPFNHPIHFNKKLVKYGILSEEQISQGYLTVPNGTKQMRYPLSKLTWSETTNKPFNIVFIFVDSLRFDMLTEEVMPNTWKFAKNAIRFDDHWSGGINTRHGIFTTFTGLPGSYWFKSLQTLTPSILVQALREKNYRIGAFTGAPLSMPEFNKTVFAWQKDLRVEARGDTVLERDQFALEDFENWLNKTAADQSFFSFIFFDNVHSAVFPEDDEHTRFQPYLKEVNQLELTKDTDREPYFNRYKNAAFYADKQIQKVLDLLSERDLMDQTIVVISSDHGEEFNDNKTNFWMHNGNFTQYQAKIPLVISWPGKSKNIVRHRTSGLDLVPTLLKDALGCSNPITDYSSGSLLWEDSKRPFLFISNYSKNAYLEEKRTLIVDEKGFLVFVDDKNAKTNDKSIPAYLKSAMEEQTKFLK